MFHRFRNRISAFLCENRSFAQVARFGAVGMFTTGMYGGSTYLLHQFVLLSLPLAASISYVLASTINYALHHSWTFQSSRGHASAAPRFFATAIAGMTINYAVVMLSQHSLLLPQALALFVGVSAVFAWNYLIARFWVFVQHRRRI
jgi:putative flippase GtrA